MWKNRKVVVTGADGFIGSHLVEKLLEHGAEVTAVVRRTSRTQINNNFTNLKNIINNLKLKIVKVDLAGPSAINVLSQLDGEYWFHMAADAYVPASFEQPSSVVFNNIVSTMNILESLDIKKTKNAIIISSSEVYGSCSEPLTEKHALNPTTPYAASKVAVDRLAWTYKKTFDTPVTIVRPFNTYGPRHIYDVVPLFIKEALNGRDIIINGDGLQTRDLTYVDDMVEALLILGDLDGDGEVYNIGTGIDYSILEIAETIKKITNSSSEIVHGPPRKGEVKKLQANVSKIKKDTFWEPKTTFEDGIRKNVEWYRKELKHD